MSLGNVAARIGLDLLGLEGTCSDWTKLTGHAWITTDLQRQMDEDILQKSLIHWKVSLRTSYMT